MNSSGEFTSIYLVNHIGVTPILGCPSSDVRVGYRIESILASPAYITKVRSVGEMSEPGSGVDRRECGARKSQDRSGGTHRKLCERIQGVKRQGEWGSSKE
jgi:hypothetical protein